MEIQKSQMSKSLWRHGFEICFLQLARAQKILDGLIRANRFADLRESIFLGFSNWAPFFGNRASGD